MPKFHPLFSLAYAGLLCTGCWGRDLPDKSSSNTAPSSGQPNSSASSPDSTSETQSSGAAQGPVAPLGYPQIHSCSAPSSSLIPGRDGTLLVTSTDGATGAVGWINPRTKQVHADLALADKDTRVKHNEQFNFVINRFGADSITLLAQDPVLSWRGSFSVTEPGSPSSNPQDLVVDTSGHLHVSFLGRDHLKVYDISDTSHVKLTRTIDLRAFADQDGLPEASAIIACGETYFVLVQRLDRDKGWAPVDHSFLVPIHAPTGTFYDFDGSQDQRPDAIQLIGTGMSTWRKDPRVADGTSILALNRGLSQVNLKNGQVQTVIPERVFIDKGMDVWDVRNFEVSADGRWVWILAIDNWPKHSIFRAALDQSGQDLVPVVTDIESVSGSMIRVDNTLWLADTTDGRSGVRIFDLHQDQLSESPDSPLAVGLAPSWLHLVP